MELFSRAPRASGESGPNGQVLIEAGVGGPGRQVVEDPGMYGVAVFGEPEGRASIGRLPALAHQLLSCRQIFAPGELSGVAMASRACARSPYEKLARPPLWP